MISRFLSWWIGELTALVPGPVRALAAPRRRLLVDAGDLCLSLDRRGTRTALGALDELDGTLLKDLRRASRNGQLPVTLMIEDRTAVHRTLSLPDAARQDLASVVSYEIDRLTPFAPDELWYGVGAPRPVAGTNRIEVDVVFTPRSALAPVLDCLTAAGFSVQEIVVATDSRLSGLNLLGDLSSWRWTWGRRLTAGLAIMLAMLSGTWLWMVFDNQRDRIEMLSAELRLERRQAQASEKVETMDGIPSDPITKAYVLRQDRPLAVEVLAKASKIAPDGTWADSITYTPASLDVAGLSQSATELIGQFEADPLFQSVVFRAPVVSTQEGERFLLSADLTERRAP